MIMDITGNPASGSGSATTEPDWHDLIDVCLHTCAEDFIGTGNTHTDFYMGVRDDKAALQAVRRAYILANGEKPTDESIASGLKWLDDRLAEL